ncbi:hypothetical protein [Chitinimonas sp.]|uniref:hypothetical protein n=1 Tax=Chitinimonas sp. TaxID=1934313 RepID=UPI0035B49B9E
MKHFAHYIGELLYLGWMEQAIDLSRSACWALEAGFGWDLDGSAQNQYFLLCLMADWQGWPRPKMSPGTLDDPLLTLLLAHWRTPEPDDLHDLLLALCDRRTQQVDDRQDFSGNVLRWYFPYEILAVFRLREQLGLSNPTLDHLVMKTQMAVLPPPQALYDDPFLQKILQHIRAEWPEVQADYLRLPR